MNQHDPRHPAQERQDTRNEPFNYELRVGLWTGGGTTEKRERRQVWHDKTQTPRLRAAEYSRSYLRSKSDSSVLETDM